ncbi:MAG: hypothetical protein EOP09_11450 [Proteobacteria bacterium]|nr:MAG: hypothetical protein EOP09_11450 [Pseudomonadota bacterium]
MKAARVLLTVVMIFPALVFADVSSNNGGLPDSCKIKVASAAKMALYKAVTTGKLKKHATEASAVQITLDSVLTIDRYDLETVDTKNPMMMVSVVAEHRTQAENYMFVIDAAVNDDCSIVQTGGVSIQYGQ